MFSKWSNDEYAALSFVLFVAFVFAVIGVLIYAVVAHFFGPLVGVVVAITGVCGWVVYHV